MGLIRPLALLGTLAGLTLGQDCPILGPAYPEVLNPSTSTVFAAAKVTFEDEITKALASGQLDNGTAFSIQVFSRNSDKLLFEHHHGPSIGPDTLYRIGSISKVMTVYTTLAQLGDRYWTEPVTKYVPELARLKARDPAYDTDWSEVTLGALASYLSGIARDYALGDIAPYLPPGIPGIPTLNAKEQIQCGTSGLRACTRAEALARIAHTYPISPTHHTPAYSNMAFQLLAYAVEKITSKKFSSLVTTRLLTPLNLTHTFLTKPANPANAIILDGWDLDFGEESPAGGYYSTPSDLTVLARSILRSTLLPAALTRSWLQPLSHTANLALSLGRPWEIPRLSLPGSTAPIDLYTKQGAVGAYLSLLALSPAQGVGYTVLTAGGKSAATYAWLQEKVDGIFLAAAEAAAREEAGRRFAGSYTVADGSVVEITLRDGEPGLFVNSLVSNGTDVLGLVGPLVGAPAGVKMGVWLYPTSSTAKGAVGGKGGRIAFRGTIGAVGLPAGAGCAAWGAIDTVRYGGAGADLFVFEVEGGEEGSAAAVEVPILRKTFVRADGKGKCKL